MGTLSSLTKSIYGRKEQQPRLYETEQQKQAKGIISNFLKNYSPESYKKPLTAELTGTEKQGQGILSRYIGRDMPELYTAGSKQVLDTLQGGFDPATSDYYKALRGEINKEADIGAHRLAQHGQKAGAPQSATLTGLSGLESDRQGQLATIMAELAQQERQNQLGVLPYAQQFGNLEDTKDLASIAAISQYGSLPREVEQTGLSADYAKFLQEQDANQYLPEFALQFLQGYNPYYSLPSYGQSRFEQGTDILSGASDLFSNIASLFA